MFGYVRPLPDEMKVRDLRRWREDYCGLCRCLGKRYGFFARLLLSYDMTFLYALLTMHETAAKGKRCWCPASVCGRKACAPSNDAMEYAADLTVLLSVWKLRDEQRDSGFFRRMGAGLALRLYGRAAKKAAAARPEENRRIEAELQRLSRLEAEKCPSIDETADAFASILRSCAAWWSEPSERRPAEQVLYHVGRYVYLVDALDDLRRDCEEENYNPLRYRFSVKEGALSAEDRDYLLQVLNTSLDLAASAFELMERKREGAVVENILYYGLPTVLRAVSEGKFNPRKKQRTPS